MISAATKGAGLALPLTRQAQRGFDQGVSAGLQVHRVCCVCVCCVCMCVVSLWIFHGNGLGMYTITSLFDCIHLSMYSQMNGYPSNL